jgi:hypothetical protein
VIFDLIDLTVLYCPFLSLSSTCVYYCIAMASANSSSASDVVVDVAVFVAYGVAPTTIAASISRFARVAITPVFCV